jgi:glycosyltransferase involved in cell wall biosynthesis
MAFRSLARNYLRGLMRSLAPARHPIPDELTGDAVAPVRRELVADLGGFYPQSPVELAEGLAWMGEQGSVRLDGLSAGAELTVTGSHLADAHQRAHGGHALHLRLRVDGAVVHEEALTRPGRFTLRAQLPASAGARRRLELQCSQTFVPAHLGLNQDLRALSLQIATVSVGGKAVVEFARAGGAFQAGPGAAAVPGVTVVGYLDANTGVGQSARGFAQACAAAGLAHQLIDVDRLEPQAIAAAGAPVKVLHVNADQIPIVHRALGKGFFGKGSYTIGFWVWELAELPDAYLDSFAFLDEVWVPSRFVQDAVSLKSPVPVVHMPYPIDFEVGALPPRARFGLPDDKFLFLVMYDLRSYQVRKNPDGAIAAFQRACAGRGDVGLVVKVTGAASHPVELAELRARLAEVPGAVLIEHSLSRQEIYELEALCDAYLSLHRSEGWGMNLSESMLLGKPVVATAWSGNLDFMTAENSCLVDFELRPLTEDVGPYRKGQLWAEPDVEHAAAHIRRLLDDAELRRRLGERARRTIRERYSHRALGERYRQRLRTIARML